MIRYLKEDGTFEKGFHPSLEDKKVVEAYKIMLKTALFDKKMTTLQRQGAISFSLSSRGEEAIATAATMALNPKDWIYPQYREAAVMFARGLPIQDFVHHMFSNDKDILQGRQMPNHFGSKELCVVTVSSPIATFIPHAAGAAYGMKLLSENKVALCFFGEGATSEGDFHTGLNFAAVRGAPVIYLCRNNGYAISTKSKEQYLPEYLVSKAPGYGIDSYLVDGNDFFAVYETVSKAREQALEGRPIFIEAMTYRLGAHSTSDDPSLYRPQSEVEEALKRCPILRMRRFLERASLWDENQEKDFIDTIEKELALAIKEAKATNKPLLDTLIEHVTFEKTETLQRQLAEVKEIYG